MINLPVAFLLLALTSMPLSASMLIDVDGNEHALPDPNSKATVVYFVTQDCPISNRFMPEIRRICGEYSSRDTRCLMAYVDATATADQIREHRQTYESTVPAVHDLNHALVALADASVTPEAALFDRAGNLAYRGRINNFYADLGTPRRQATKHDLRDALEDVLAGRAVSQPRTQAVGCFISKFGTAQVQETP